MIKFAMISLILSSSLLGSENQTNALVRRDSYPQCNQTLYVKNPKPHKEEWATKIYSPQLGPLYIANRAGRTISGPNASAFFHKLERAYHQQVEHKDEKN